MRPVPFVQTRSIARNPVHAAALGAALVCLGAGAGQAFGHGALEVLVGRSAAGQLVVLAETHEAVHVPRSVFPNLIGYATPSIGFEDLPLDEPSAGVFVLPAGTTVRVRLLSIDAGLSVYDGFAAVPVGGTITLGETPFDVHPLFNIVTTAQPGQTFHAMVQIEDVSTGPGALTTSEPVEIAVTPACVADTDLSGTVTVQDIFDYIALYFAGLPRADIDGSGTVSVQDVFEYLTAYFSPCG